MRFIDTWCLALLGLLLCAICLCSCATGLGGGRHYGEVITLPFVFQDNEAVWEIGHAAGDQVQRITEWIRPGQTVENWTELVTCQTFNKANDLGSVEGQFAANQEDLVARCPGSTAEVIRELPDGILYESRVVNCEQGSDEHILARILDGTSNRFVILYAVRGAVAMTPERRTEWIGELMAVKIR